MANKNSPKNIVFGLKNFRVRFSMCSKSSDYLNVSRFLALNKRSFTYYVHIVLPASCLYALHLMPRNSENFRPSNKFIRCQYQSRIYESWSFFHENECCDLHLQYIKIICKQSQFREKNSEFIDSDIVLISDELVVR